MTGLYLRSGRLSLYQAILHVGLQLDEQIRRIVMEVSSFSNMSPEMSR